jgi:hypothetical protein
VIWNKYNAHKKVYAIEEPDVHSSSRTIQISPRRTHPFLKRKPFHWGMREMGILPSSRQADGPQPLQFARHAGWLAALIIGAMSLFAGCQPSPPAQEVPSHSHRISRIAVHATGCYGECPHWALEIDRSLKTKFWGGSYASLEGYHVGTAPRQIWDSLCIQLENAHYDQLDTTKTVIEDASHYSLVISRPPETDVRFQRWLATSEDDLSAVVIKMYSSLPRLSLHPSSDSIRFQSLGLAPSFFEIVEFKVPHPFGEDE